jgi:hypothetical protein
MAGSGTPANLDRSRPRSSCEGTLESTLIIIMRETKICVELERAFNTTLRVYLFQLSGLAAESLPILNQFSVDQAGIRLQPAMPPTRLPLPSAPKRDLRNPQRSSYLGFPLPVT